MPNFGYRQAVSFAAAGAASLAVVLSGCAPSTEVQNDDDRLVVVTTFTVIADIAANVAGERARVESITRPGVEIHGYQPTANDVIRASDADLVLHHGLGLEAWFADFVTRIDAPSVTITGEITPLPIEGSNAPNPHAWMSIANASHYVDSIAAALSDIDPAGSAYYDANAASYLMQIEAVGADLSAALAELPPERRVLVTCEGAFSYLAADAGLTEVYLWPVNAESQSTPQSVRAAIEAVRESSVPAVFCESTVNQGGMMQVAQESGAAYGGVLYVDSLSEPDGPVPTYLDLLRVNTETIIAGLTGLAP
jgi:manganese transport system substrate-binding protein